MFVDPKTVLLRWQEPALVAFRVRSWSGWIGRLIFFSLVYLVIWSGMVREEAERPDRRFSSPLVRTLLVPALGAAFILALIELPHVQRTIIISKSGIDCGGGPLSSHLSLAVKALLTRQWNPREIREVQLLRQGEPGNRLPCAIMIVTPKYARPGTIGISRKVSLLQVAAVMESLGVAVKCSDLADVPLQAAETSPKRSRLQ